MRVIWLILAVLACLPLPYSAVAKQDIGEPVLVERHDVVELNHFYDDNGRLIFSQVIWYDLVFDDEKPDGQFIVKAWKLTPQHRCIPLKTSDGYTSVFLDGIDLRKVIAGSMRETWEQFDPELENRQRKPQELRGGLAMPGMK